MIDLDELERLALHSTPGPWFVCERPNNDGTSNIETGRIADWNPAQNCEHPTADYIAACDPQTILALIKLARKAQG